jgi:Ca-activated chloride channel homolog
MFRFENKEILYLLIVVPILVFGYYLYRYNHNKRLKKYGNLSVLKQLMPLRSSFRPALKFYFVLTTIILMVVALARPQFGSKLKEVKREGIEMILALDVSNSMLATDISPNRLERAKQAINSLVNKMKDDKIGLIVFAGDAYTQLPITSDYISAKMFLSNISPNFVSKQGTAIGKAIDLASKSFSQVEEASKVIVIISDGENHEGDAVDAAKAAAEKGITIFTIGMGSTQGSLIPKKNGSGFVTDRQGNPVTTRMNPEMLNQIALAGDGKYFTATSNNVHLGELYSELRKLEKAEIDIQTYSEYDDQYTYFIAFAILLLIAELLIMERKNKWLSNFNLFS